MKTVKLSKSQIKRVEEWLECMPGVAEDKCPFQDKGYWFCRRICWKLFTRIGAETWSCCPCSEYSYRYVRKMAINLLKSQV